MKRSYLLFSLLLSVFCIELSAQSYTIGIAEQQNCSITLSPQKDTYVEGDEITVTLLPSSPNAQLSYFEVYYECSEDEWWAAQSASVKPQRPLAARRTAPRRASAFGNRHRLEIWHLSGHEDEPEEVGTNSFTFVMPARNVEMEAVFIAEASGGYNITIEQTGNGTTSADKSNAAAGTTVNVTATPASGYSVDQVLITVRETIGGAIYVTLIDNVTRTDLTHFTFTMPTSDVRVKATYRPSNVGDINRDDLITIADVTALVNIILGKDDGPTPLYDHAAADVNTDGSITIADVTALVNIILGKN